MKYLKAGCLLFSVMFFQTNITFQSEAFAHWEEHEEYDAIKKQHHRALSRVGNYLDQGDLEKADRHLQTLLNKNGLSDIAKAYAAHYGSLICFKRDDNDCAMTYLEQIIERRLSIPAEFYSDSLFKIAQIHFLKMDYSKTIKFGLMHKDMDEKQNKQLNILLAQAYYQLQNYEKTLAYVLADIDISDPEKTPIKTGKVRLFIKTCAKLNQLEFALRYVDSMSNINPKKSFKLWIAEAYGEMGREDKMNDIKKELI